MKHLSLQVINSQEKLTCVSLLPQRFRKTFAHESKY